MALAETANLIVNLQLKGGISKALAKESRALGTFDARLDKTESRAFRAGQQIGTGIRRGVALGVGGLALLGTQIFAGLDSLVELEKQQKQTEAAIKSTGGVAGITAERVRELAEEYESLNATVGDETIQQTENLLLSFTNIRKDAFEPALKAILDMNTRLGRGPDGLAGTARQVGRALNDPTKGLALLTRAGVQLDEATVKRIKRLQKEGKLYEAQGVILGELNKRFAGAFAAEGGTTGGRVAKFRDAIEDLQRTLAAGLLPVVSNIADALDELFRDPAVQRGVAEFGQSLAKLLSPGAIKSGISAIKDVFSTIAAVAGPAASAVGAMVAAFNRLPPDLRNLLVGAFAVNKLTGGLVTNIAGGLVGALGSALKTIVAGHVTVVSKGGVGGVPGGGGGGVAGKVGAALSVAAVVAGVAGVIAAQQEQSNQNTGIAQGIQTGLNRSIAGKTLPQLRTALAGVNTGIAQIQSNPLHMFVQGDALNTLHSMRNQLTTQIQKVETVRAMAQKTKDDTVRATNATKQSLGAKIAETKRETSRGVVAMQAVKAAENAGTSRIVGATHSQTSAIVGALYATRVTVQSVTKNTTIVQRYGPSNGSSGRFGQ